MAKEKVKHLIGVFFYNHLFDHFVCGSYLWKAV